MSTDQRNTHVFPRLTDQDLEDLRAYATCRRFQDGKMLFEAGQRNFSFFVVIEGAVEILDVTHGEPRRVTLHYPREFTGDVDMLTGRPAVVSAIARGECQVIQLSAEELRRLLREKSNLGERILRAFLLRREILEEEGFAGMRVIGSRFSRDTFRIREFLSRNSVLYAWIDLEGDPQVDAVLSELGIRAEETPIVTCGVRAIQRNPSNLDLAECLGIRSPVGSDVWDLVIVGSGPAGLAAAVYGASEGLKTLVLDQVAPGGQAGNSSRIENYMGFPTGITGAELAKRAMLQAQKFGARFMSPASAVVLRCEPTRKTLVLDDGQEVYARCVLIATGASYVKLPVAGCEQFEGAGIYYAATVVEAAHCSQATAIVVGGGNSAGQAAVFLSAHAESLLLCIRGGDLRKSMSAYLANRIEQIPNIKLCTHTAVAGLHGNGTLEAVDLCDKASDLVRCQVAKALFVFIGARPHTDWVQATVLTDRSGFIQTGAEVAQSDHWPLARSPHLLETSCPGVFAAGDVRSGSVKRVATAVGEGSMTVQLVHAHLAAI